MPTAKNPFNVIGTNAPRWDGVDKVRGRANYGADIYRPNMLHARVLCSPHAHAVIKRIDASKALELPGVKAVVTKSFVDDEGSKSRLESAKFVIELDGRAPVTGVLYAPENGVALVRVGRWLAEVTESQHKDVLGDIDAALGAE